MTVDPESGTLYAGASSSGDAKMYSISPKGNVNVIGKAADEPSSLIMDGASHVLYTAGASVFRMKLVNGESEKVADGIGKARGAGLGSPRPALRR